MAKKEHLVADVNDYVYHRSNPNSIGQIQSVGLNGKWCKVLWADGISREERRAQIHDLHELCIAKSNREKSNES